MCKDDTDAGCLSCQFAHFLSATGTCSVCPSGRGKPADTAVQTLVQIGTDCSNLCTEGCQNCILSAANSCVSCKAGYYRSDTNSCSICTLGTGGPGSPLSGPKVTEALGCPDTCHFSCKTCSGPDANNCIKCKAGYFLSAAGTCSICPFGTGKSDDTEVPSVSTTAGDTECLIRCHATCRTCFDDKPNTCVNCRAGHFWESGVCTQCPAKKGKPADTTIPETDQTEADCKDCHPSCNTCGASTENDCASCAAGYWWSGTGYGVLGKCESCPKSRGKSQDVEPYFITSTSAETCTIFCDLCNSGCLTCSESSSGCVSCIPGKYLAGDQKCLDCPENCQSCTAADKCEVCHPNFELTLDSKSCLKCQIKNCGECKSDPFKCTKCADKFTLKSATECVYEPKVLPLSLNLSYVSITENKELTLNLLENKLEFPFNSRESTNFTSITMEDKLAGKFYSCEQLGCSYSISEEKLKLRFESETTVQQGRLIIERGAGSRPKTSAIQYNKNGRQLQTQESYRIVADGIALMKKSWLTTGSQAVRIVVGVLRLPFSILVFWKYPHLAMLMDHMVTHLKIYALISQPFMAYVEVVFQSVAESKILPFQFANPFEGWNTNTLECEGFLGIRSKNMQCSFFDNYGQNIIGISSVLLLCVILTRLSKYMLSSADLSTSQRTFWEHIANNYGLRFLTSKFDANHIEMTLMILVAYCTADHSSKSVVGITFGTFGLLGLGFIAKFITMALSSQYNKVSKDGLNNQSQNPQDSRLFAHRKSKSKLDNPPTEQAEFSPRNSKAGEDSDPDENSGVVSFALNASSIPNNKWSVYFFAARYVRALLLAVFVTTVRDPVEQVVLVVVLESVYLVALILLDFRGSRVERLFYTVMHALMLLHLILRAVATSKSLSDRDVQSSLAAAIVVVLMVYIFAHVIAALLVLAGIFKKSELNSPGLPNSSKIEIIQSEAVLSPSPGAKTAAQTRDPVFVLPAGPRLSYRDMEIPEEGREEPFEADIPAEDHGSPRASKIEHIKVRVEVSKPTAPGTLATDNHE